MTMGLKIPGALIPRRVFTQPGSRAALAAKGRHGRSTPECRRPGRRPWIPSRAKNRDRGEPRGSAPPHTTVRTGPYTAVREVTLTRFDQGRETERFDGRPSDLKWASSPMKGVLLRARCQGPRPLPAMLRNSPNFQRDECRSATPRSFPLAPQGGPQSQPDPASESDQFLGRFAEAEIAAPAAHIGGQLFHSRLKADAFSPSRDFLKSVARTAPAISAQSCA